MKQKALNIFTVTFIIIFVLYNNILVGYYQKSKGRLQRKTCERYEDLSEEERNKKRQHAQERYINLCKEKKRKKQQYGRERYKNVPENRKNFSKIWKNKG